MELSYREVYRMNPQEARKKLIETYQETGSLSETARRWRTSRPLVRKWVRRFLEAGEAGLRDRSRRPKTSPRKTPEEIEEKGVHLHRETGYGRHRLSWELELREGIWLSPHHPPHPAPLRRREVHPAPQGLLLAHWAWEQEEPFSLVQVDVEDIRDEKTLGPERVSPLQRFRLPRYPWTYLEVRTRLRFLAFSHQLTYPDERAVLCRVGPLLAPSSRVFEPLGAKLVRFPIGRKGQGSRVERSHWTDDEEFYLSLLLRIRSEQPSGSTITTWSGPIWERGWRGRVRGRS